MKQNLILFRFIVRGSIKYAWWSCKELIRRRIGRAPEQDCQNVFFRQYVLHLIGFRPIHAITCKIADGLGSGFGPGHQAFLVMDAISFARAAGLTYLHSPMESISGADRPMQEWVAVWESVFNLGADELPFNSSRTDAINYCGLRNLDLCFGFRDHPERVELSFKALIPEFKRKYYLRASHVSDSEIRVAVNIRRGEVSADQANFMFTSACKILRMVTGVASCLVSHGLPFRLHVYGQGQSEEFAELSQFGARLFLNADPLWTLRELVESDVLIVAKSHFSYYAGLISDGIKIFEPSAVPRGNHSLSIAWQWPLFSTMDDWLACQDDGAIDRAAFERRLEQLLKRRAASPA